jgi:prepilin-type N-terminal cleavage/methylation domain-containing protein
MQTLQFPGQTHKGNIIVKIEHVLPIGENDNETARSHMLNKEKKIGNWKLENRNSRQSRAGFSLIEMLVVLFVFSILAVVSSQALTLTLRGSRKSESVTQSRENIQYAMNVMDRLIKSAKDLTCTTSTPNDRVDYVDEYGNAAYFECLTSNGNSYIASNSASARLTSDQVNITNCSQVFTCTNGTGIPDSVDISIFAVDSNVTGSDGASITAATKIFLRNY